MPGQSTAGRCRAQFRCCDVTRAEGDDRIISSARRVDERLTLSWSSLKEAQMSLMRYNGLSGLAVNDLEAKREGRERRQRHRLREALGLLETGSEVAGAKFSLKTAAHIQGDIARRTCERQAWIPQRRRLRPGERRAGAKPGSRRARWTRARGRPRRGRRGRDAWLKSERSGGEEGSV